MKILIIDRDDVTTRLIQSKLEPLGHQVSVEAAKNDALDKLSSGGFNVIMIDPSPLNDARSLVFSMRRETGNYPYIILLSESADLEAALKSGCNNILNKPLDIGTLDEKIGNARALIKLVERISDDSEDFPSAGGVIAKSAFNQLFLSGIDRAGRYGERSYVLFISMSNYGDVSTREGQYAADTAVAKLSQYLVLLRRQSDIIGQTAGNEFALLMQRPNFEHEPMEAAKRFAEALEGYGELKLESGAPVEVTVSLVDLPVGSKVVEYVVTPGQEKARRDQ